MKTMFYTLRRNAALCASLLLCCSCAPRSRAQQPAATPASPAEKAQAELAKDEHERLKAQAQAWFDASVALAKKGRLIAVGQVWRTDKMVASFRYDRLPGVERVLAPDDAWFARPAGKAWVQSADWGKSGAPADAKTVAELDAIAELAQRPFEPVAPDPREGAVAWRYLGPGGAFEQSREKPRPGQPMNDLIFDAFMYKDFDGYPLFDFRNDEKQVDEGMLLRDVKTPWTWEGDKVFVGISYYYRPETEPPPGGEPGDQVAAALDATNAKPFKVDAVISGREKVRVAGIISGKDFDLTVTVPAKGKAIRQIAVGADSWLSEDGGATWRKQDQPDRSPFDLVELVLKGKAFFGNVLAGPYDVSDAGPGDAGGTLRRYTLQFQPPVSFDIAMKDGKPVAACRFLQGYVQDYGKLYGHDAVGQLCAQFSGVTAAQPVRPPPGNPEAVPQPDADDSLATALKAMQAGVWRAQMRTIEEEQAAPGKDEWISGQTTDLLYGLFSGNDFDLESESAMMIDSSHVNNRYIGIGGKSWVGFDGPPWRDEAEFKKTIEGVHASMHAPFESNFTSPHYESAGTETHEGETWLHIRQAGAGDASGSPQYWLLLDKEGKPASVRRCSWVSWQGEGMGARLERSYNEEDFTPAKPGEKITPPAGAGNDGAGQK